MKLITLSVFTIALALTAVVPLRAQGQAGSGVQDSGPYLFGKDTYEFTVYPNGNGMIYKLGSNKEIAGIIIAGQITGPGGKPPADAALKAFDAYKAGIPSGGGGPTAVVVETPPSVQPRDATTTGGGDTPSKGVWDAPSKTATLSNGWSITFIDNDHMAVRLPGAAAVEYDLRYHGKSAGGLMTSWASEMRGNKGGSILGDGVEISTRVQGGPPAVVFDTGSGTMTRRQLPTGIVDAVREAVGVAPPTFGSSAVAKGLLNNHLGM